MPEQKFSMLQDIEACPTVKEGLLDEGVYRHQPVPPLGLNPDIVPYNLLGVPIQDEDRPA